MPNTYSQLFVHIIFAVKGRESILKKENKEELHKYITGIINNKKQKLYAINSVSDHMHILVSYTPDCAVSELVRDIKANSSRFINEKKWYPVQFNWQTGFGAFSYAKSQVDNVINYIKNQELHHRKKQFREEYIEILEKYSVEYKPEYLFEWIE